jgi:hypothetical protein
LKKRKKKEEAGSEEDGEVKPKSTAFEAKRQKVAAPFYGNMDWKN